MLLKLDSQDRTMVKGKYIEIGIRNNLYRIKGLILKLYLTLHGCKVGKNLKCKQWPIFRTIPHRNILIGNNVSIGTSISFSVDGEGELSVGDDVNLTHNIMISSMAKVDIGNKAQIAENVSIRDADHKMVRDQFICDQGFLCKPIVIESDVWIGANSLIFKGSHLRKGVIIGASSLVTGSTETEDYGIYVGTPIRYLKSRVDSE